MMNNFKYAISLAQMLYDIDINDMDTLIEIGLVAYNFIGNKKETCYEQSIIKKLQRIYANRHKHILFTL